jgi:hypothetical protein
MARPPKVIKIQACIDILQKQFSRFPDPRKGFKLISLHDFLMSGYAIFALKYPSLLSFETAMRGQDERKKNLKSLFSVDQVPSDTHLRDIMDQIDWRCFRPIFKELFANIQDSKLLEKFEFMRINNRPHYLLNVDGTGYFRSDKIGCDCCLKYEGSEKKKLPSFGHNMLGASLAVPDSNVVIPFCPEPIMKQDGTDKNDHERNAFKRFVSDFRREHPKLDVIMGLDALYANDPCLNLLFENDCSFIIGIKETNGTVYMQVNERDNKGEIGKLEYTYEIGDKVKKLVHHRFRFTENVRLTQNMNSSRINFVEFWEVISWEGKNGPEEEKRHFAWITDLKVNKETVVQIMKGGRARWKIENETFNTLKNQGYHLEHNYGHGSENLSINFIMMMFLSFMIDQIQQAGCLEFKKALEKFGSKKMLWQEMASRFLYFHFETWEQFFGVLTKEISVRSEFIVESS